MALYPTWQPQARDFGSTTTTSDNTVLTWHSRYKISLVEVILVLNFKILKLTDYYMQLIDVVALYPTWQPQARDFGSTTTTSDNTVLTWHSRYEISLVEVLLVLNFKLLKLTDNYMQKSGQTIGFGVPPTHPWPYEGEQSGSGGGAGGGISQTRLVCYPPQLKRMAVGVSRPTFMMS